MIKNNFKFLKSVILFFSIITGLSLTACSTATEGSSENTSDTYVPTDNSGTENSNDGNAIAYFLCEKLSTSLDEHSSQNETVKLCFYSDKTVKLRATSLDDKNGKYGQRYDKLRGTYTGDPTQKNGSLEITITEEVEWESYLPKTTYSSEEEAKNDIHWKPTYHTFKPSNGETKWLATITDDVLKFSNGTYKDVTTLDQIYNFDRTTDTDLGPYIYHGIARRKYNGTLTSWKIPEGYSSVGNFCFYGYEYKNGDYVLSEDYKNLKKVILPSTIKKISDQAFKNCVALNEINIPEGCIEIGQGAFSDCSSLEKITLPSTIKTIGACAFAKECTDSTLEAEEGSKNILEITFADGITKIPDESFNMAYVNNISEIKSVSIPSSVKVIGKEAFFDIKTPITIVIPEGVEEIEDLAFSHCNTSISLPKSLKKIGKEAFYYNQEEKIEIPEGVEEIGEDAFVQGYDEDEIKLKELILPSTLKEFNSNAFSEEKLEKLTIKNSISFLCSVMDAWRLYLNSDCHIFYKNDDVTDYFTNSLDFDYNIRRVYDYLKDKMWKNKDDIFINFNSDRSYWYVETNSEEDKTLRKEEYGLWKLENPNSQMKLVFYTESSITKEYYILAFNDFLYMEESLEDLKDESISNANRFEFVEKTK